MANQKAVAVISEVYKSLVIKHPGHEDQSVHGNRGGGAGKKEQAGSQKKNPKSAGEKTKGPTRAGSFQARAAARSAAPVSPEESKKLQAWATKQTAKLTAAHEAKVGGLKQGIKEKEARLAEVRAAKQESMKKLGIPTNLDLKMAAPLLRDIKTTTVEMMRDQGKSGPVAKLLDAAHSTMGSAIENVRLNRDHSDTYHALREQVWTSKPGNTIENMPDDDTPESDALYDETDDVLKKLVKGGF